MTRKPRILMADVDYELKPLPDGGAYLNISKNDVPKEMWDLVQKISQSPRQGQGIPCLMKDGALVILSNGK